MTVAGLNAPRETTPLMHKSCNNGMIQLRRLSSYMRCLRSSRSVMHGLYTLSCNILHTLSHFSHAAGFKSSEFGGRRKGTMNFGVSFLAKTAFFNDVKITSSLRSAVQVLMEHFTIFHHTDCQDDSCQKL